MGRINNVTSAMYDTLNSGYNITNFIRHEADAQHDNQPLEAREERRMLHPARRHRERGAALPQSADEEDNPDN